MSQLFRLIRIAFAALLLVGCVPAIYAWTPGTVSPTATGGFAVNTSQRDDVLSFYNCIYNSSQSYPSDMGWSGTVNPPVYVAGTNTALFQEDVLRRINFYRALVSMPASITLTATNNSGDQNAALMFSANKNITHNPPDTWIAWTTTGSNAASNSNIALGVFGPGAIDAYMVDSGANNAPVGHRRWLIYSQQQTMGTGDVPTSINSSGTYYCANANWVISNFSATPLQQFVPWPNSGYIPLPLVPARWSLSYPDADFTSATVTMTQSGSDVPVSIVSTTTGYGDNAIVWTPSGMPPASISADTPYNVTVAGISGSGVPTSYSYAVTLFDPNVLDGSVTITGTSKPYVSGGNYTFNSIPSADYYTLQVSTSSTVSWVEGSGTSPAPTVQADTTGSYTLYQTAVVYSSDKGAFHLAFPDFNDQSFTIMRNIMPTAASVLQFYDRGRYATTTSVLSTQVSTDNGNTWTSVWSRNGVGLSNADWDGAFILNNVSLSAYAGQVINVRFIYTYDPNSTSIGTSSSFGFFIDSITVTNASQLVNTTSTTLSGTAASFTLNATTAGAALSSGTTYYMQIAPTIGLRQYGYGPLSVVTAQPLISYSNWVTSEYPQVTSGPNGDYANDGISNGMAFAFGMNPTVHNSPGSLPQPVINGGTMSVAYTQPPGVTGVTYGAQWSPDLVNWSSLTDTGTNGTHIFSVSTAGQTKMFFHNTIVISP